ncbi:histone-lysine N-methyltransferase SETMAR [Trichonephila clavipes]|nr:histone-lysine N-methyltransferase SETMAR [Trichonephila clavipes]
MFIIWLLVHSNVKIYTRQLNGAYGDDTVTINYVQFWSRRFRSGIFDVKHAPRTCRPTVKNVDKTTGIIEIDRHVRSRSTAQELRINHKIVSNHLRKKQVGFKKKLNVWEPLKLTPKNMMDQISICEAFSKRNEINQFLKRMVTEDEKWITYDNIVRKRSWSKSSEAAHSVARTNGQEAIGVSSRPKLTGIVRGKAFLHVLRRRPIGCPDSRKRTKPIIPDVMDMIENDID